MPPISDYNASAALNLLLGSIPIGPGMEREKVNNAFQQLMADISVLADVPNFVTRSQVPFEKYLPTTYNYLTDDCSAALATAWAASIANNTVITFSRRYYLAQGVTLTGAGAFHFDNARFDLDNGMTAQTLFGATSGKIGFIYKNAGGASLTGSRRIYGRGTSMDPTTGNTICGEIFYRCNNMLATGHVHYEDISIGCIPHSSNDMVMGLITANNISGQQTFGVGTGGDGISIVGCKRLRIAGINALGVYKAGVYFSVGADEAAVVNVNENITVGDVFVTRRTGSTQSSAVAFRMAVRCRVGNILTDSHAALLGRTYLGDTASTNDLNRVGNVRRFGASGTGAAVDYALGEVGAPTFGSVIVGDIDDDGSAVGINIATTAKVTYGQAKIVAALPISVSSGANLIGGYTEVSGQSMEAVIFNTGSLATISQIHIASGHSTGGASTYQGVRNYATTGVNIGRVTYTQNGIGQNVIHPYFADNSSPSTCSLFHCPNVGSSGFAARWQSMQFVTIREGAFYCTAAPTVITTRIGDIFYNSAPAAGGIVAWVSRTAGSPGTMEPVGIAGAIQAANVAAIATADATDLATVITLANATKAKVNAILAGQVTAKQMA